ncbi:bacterial stress protein [Capnocytophaga sp. oral taxon 863 str. F0517]|uniref:TerD family protein n=1 Tax=Capnocytophaga sp. oral taxon 863 TaxID=1227265 RepID=UPI000397C1B7|nr:TerD family protein [Capnocytophaga sp. oral taxon 863]ERI64366.1 bacterial stress protein [Capnocytophaga sp. oral taxon 863 str. F0517]
MAINLQKGQKIDLRKDTGDRLQNFCIGANWGAIETTSKILFGLASKKETIDVDLDLSCIVIDENNKLYDHLYSPLYNTALLRNYNLPKGKLTTNDGALHHTGDDLEGDKGGDDELDNEIITVDLKRVNPRVSKIFFFLNNVGKEDFSQIPYAKIRMFEGSPERVNSVFASYNVSAEPSFKGKRSLILAKLYKKNDEWKFDAIGDPTDDIFIGQTIQRILKNYL